jgi:hypothetical protein
MSSVSKKIACIVLAVAGLSGGQDNEMRVAAIQIGRMESSGYNNIQQDPMDLVPQSEQTSQFAYLADAAYSSNVDDKGQHQEIKPNDLEMRRTWKCTEHNSKDFVARAVQKSTMAPALLPLLFRALCWNDDWLHKRVYSQTHIDKNVPHPIPLSYSLKKENYLDRDFTILAAKKEYFIVGMNKRTDENNGFVSFQHGFLVYKGTEEIINDQVWKNLNPFVQKIGPKGEQISVHQGFYNQAVLAYDDLVELHKQGLTLEHGGRGLSSLFKSLSLGGHSLGGSGATVARALLNCQQKPDGQQAKQMATNAKVNLQDLETSSGNDEGKSEKKPKEYKDKTCWDFDFEKQLDLYTFGMPPVFYRDNLDGTTLHTRIAGMMRLDKSTTTPQQQRFLNVVNNNDPMPRFYFKKGRIYNFYEHLNATSTDERFRVLLGSKNEGSEIFTKETADTINENPSMLDPAWWKLANMDHPMSEYTKMLTDDIDRVSLQGDIERELRNLRLREFENYGPGGESSSGSLIGYPVLGPNKKILNPIGIQNMFETQDPPLLNNNYTVNSYQTM